MYIHNHLQAFYKAKRFYRILSRLPRETTKPQCLEASPAVAGDIKLYNRSIAP